jgi:hypothetical protein
MNICVKRLFIFDRKSSTRIRYTFIYILKYLYAIQIKMNIIYIKD